MAEAGGRLRSVLGKYANFLRERKLALPKHQSHLVRRVREFLLFAWQQGPSGFVQARERMSSICYPVKRKKRPVRWMKLGSRCFRIALTWLAVLSRGERGFVGCVETHQDGRSTPIRGASRRTLRLFSQARLSAAARFV